MLSCFAAMYSTGYSSDSSSSSGSWTEAPDAEYCKRFMCTEDNMTWVPIMPPGAPPFKLYNNVTACDALLEKGIGMIFFSGDSYMRQIYAAMLITLSGDYRYGSIKDPEASPHCEYHRQFFEKKCGTHSLNHYGEPCGGKIKLDPILHQLPYKKDLDLCTRSSSKSTPPLLLMIKHPKAPTLYYSPFDHKPLYPLYPPSQSQKQS